MTKKSPEMRHTERVMVNFTKEELTRVLAFAERMRVLIGGADYSRADAVRQLTIRALDAFDKAPTPSAVERK